MLRNCSTLSTWARGWGARSVLLLLFLVFCLTGLMLLSETTRGTIRGWPRYSLPFADINCEPPAGMERQEFLNEVQYLSGQPDSIQLLDKDLSQRLAQAFAIHPWVERVEHVTIAPQKRIDVELTFRSAVLAVPLREYETLVGGCTPVDWLTVDGKRELAPGRFVDGNGVLLPPMKMNHCMFVYIGRVRPPAGSAGAPWGDAGIEAAARTAKILQPHCNRWKLQTIECSQDGLLIHGTSLLVRWGSAPGSESVDEASCQRKLEHLLGYAGQFDNANNPQPFELDVRRKDKLIQNPILK